MSHLESDKPEGTGVTVQEKNTCETCEAYVAEDGLIRYEENGAVFNAETYVVVSYDGE